jgi:hypothetical protein
MVVNRGDSPSEFINISVWLISKNLPITVPLEKYKLDKHSEIRTEGLVLPERERRKSDGVMSIAKRRWNVGKVKK